LWEGMGSAGDGFLRAFRAKPVVAGLRRTADVGGAIRHEIGVLFILGEEASLPPLVAGGLIRTRAQADEILAARAIAISTGAEALRDFRGGREQSHP